MTLEFERLQKFIVPIRYDIELIPDLEKCIFKGNIQINMEVRSSVNSIVMHCQELDIESAQLLQSDHTINYPTTPYKLTEETITFCFEKPLRRGRSTMDIIYKGYLNDKFVGFHRAKYIDRKGNVKIAAITHFEPTSARKCFPCFDEPDFKASFDITIVGPSDLTIISNMSVKEHNICSDLQRISFRSTPLMSTYLVGICIGDFEYLETRTESHKVVRVYTPIGKTEQGRFALKMAKQILEYYETYYEIVYPLPKLDLIAINEFAAGAMENWGLITYKESAILFDQDAHGMLVKQRVGRVVAHELTHMWFGNLVTMSWWDDLWLNEGYASFQEFMAIDHIFPEFDIWTQFVTTILLMALDLDALNTSHPVDVPIGHPSDIASTFDRITYSKGSSLIRMLYNYIGADDFQRGVNLYLNRHKYSNTVASDFWLALEEICKKPIGNLMYVWTKYTGFPLVTCKEEHIGSDKVLVLKQDRFCANGKNDPLQPIWMIPIQISTSKSPNKIVKDVMFQEEIMEIIIPNMEKEDWVKLNFNTTGFYRVLYTSETYKKFELSIKEQTMPPLDRIGVLNDLLAMVKAGLTSTVELLRLMMYFVNETHYAVWASLAIVINRLEGLLAHTPLAEKYSTFVRNLLQNIRREIKWASLPTDNDVVVLLKVIIFDLLVKHDDEHTLKTARSKFKGIFNESSNIKGDLRNVIYRAVAKSENEEDFTNLIDVYRKLDSVEEKIRILRVLGSCNNKKILEMTLQFSLSDEVRVQDTLYCWVSVVSNPKGAEVAWTYFQDNLNTLIDRYHLETYNFNSFVVFVTENFATEEKAGEIDNFFKINPVLGTERIIQQSVEKIRMTEEWIRRDLDAVNNYFSDKCTSAPLN